MIKLTQEPVPEVFDIWKRAAQRARQLVTFHQGDWYVLSSDPSTGLPAWERVDGKGDNSLVAAEVTQFLCERLGMDHISAAQAMIQVRSTCTGGPFPISSNVRAATTQLETNSYGVSDDEDEYGPCERTPLGEDVLNARGLEFDLRRGAQVGATMDYLDRVWLEASQYAIRCEAHWYTRDGPAGRWRILARAEGNGGVESERLYEHLARHLRNRMKVAQGLSAICFAVLLLQVRYAPAPVDPLAQTTIEPASEGSVDGWYIRGVIRGLFIHFHAGIGGVCFGYDGRWRVAIDTVGIVPGWHVLKAYSAQQYASQVLWQIQSVCRMTRPLPMALLVLALLYWSPVSPSPAWNVIDEPVLCEGADLEVLPEWFSFPLGVEEHKCEDPIKWSGGLR